MVKLPLFSDTVPRVLSPSSVTATPAKGSSWESLTVPVIVPANFASVAENSPSPSPAVTPFCPAGTSVEASTRWTDVAFASEARAAARASAGVFSGVCSVEEQPATRASPRRVTAKRRRSMAPTLTAGGGSGAQPRGIRIPWRMPRGHAKR